MARRGDLAAAIRRHEETLGTYRELGDKSGIATTLQHLAHEYRDHAELVKAHQTLKEAVQVSRETDQKAMLVSLLSLLTMVLSDQDNDPAAAKAIEEAVAIGRSLGSRSREALSQVAAASLAIEQNRAEDAERFARSAVEHYAAQHNSDSRASAYEVLTQAYLIGGKIAEARATIAKALAEQRLNVGTRLEVNTTAARLSSSSAEGAAMLRAVIDEAVKSGHLRQAMEARLRLAELQLQAGDRADARRNFARTAQEASAAGFTRIGRRAQSALQAADRPVA
jgi:hypothetical protein